MAQEVTKKRALNGLKEVVKVIEEQEIDNRGLKVVEDFLNNFPWLGECYSKKQAKDLSKFPSELLQLIFSYLSFADLKSVVMVCKRWQDVGDASKLWREMKVVIREGVCHCPQSLSAALNVVKRRRICSIKAIGLSSDKVEQIARGMKGYTKVEELDLGGESLRRIGHCSIESVEPKLFQSAFPNLLKINLSNTNPTAELLAYIFSSLTHDSKLIALDLERVDLTKVAPNEFARVARLVQLNLNNATLKPEQIRAMWEAIERAPDFSLTSLSVRNLDLSAVSPQALAKVASRAHTVDASGTSLSNSQHNAIFQSLRNSPYASSCFSTNTPVIRWHV